MHAFSKCLTECLRQVRLFLGAGDTAVSKRIEQLNSHGAKSLNRRDRKDKRKQDPFRGCLSRGWEKQEAGQEGRKQGLL